MSRELRTDYRDDKNIKPVIKQDITKMSDLKVNQTLVGTVRNVTTFGCFVDLGVEQDGLIYTSKMDGNTLNIGDCVKVTVISIDVERKRIGLKFECVV